MSSDDPIPEDFDAIEISACVGCQIKEKKHTGMTELFHGFGSPYAGLLKSPKRPLGNSSQVAALFTSPFPASMSIGGWLVSLLAAESRAL